MTRKRTDITDEDGNAIPPPDPGSPVMQIIYLLEYGRTRGFRIGPRVQVGDTIVEVRDLRQEAAVARSAREASPEVVPGSDMALVLGLEE